ncbi:sugar phosphate isomerase/epimerase [Agrobacterium sp. T29]|uniref:sugar phosphate isomerase/epimerase family protein n=1 Tax=Agrobacterium sp. T29 TaxID=2580515 RepID=UPI00115DBE7B|nr:sugar phosphate isomerase/epimerase [Agrobacterium sp. T29]
MKLGYQLYSARNFPPLSDVFARLSKAGYSAVEGYGALYERLDAAELDAFRTDLDRNGLTMPTAHFGIDLLEQEPQRVLTLAEKLGIEAIYCPFIGADNRPVNSKGWEAFGERLAAAAKPYTDKGLVFGWHNHAFEFEKTPEGDIPLDLIFKGGPDLAWEADIAWVVRGGADVDDALARHGARIKAVHVKDLAPSGEAEDEGGWADVGFGTIGWSELLPKLKQLGVVHFIIEHDNPNDLERNVSRSITSVSSY